VCPITGNLVAEFGGFYKSQRVIAKMAKRCGGHPDYPLTDEEVKANGAVLRAAGEMLAALEGLKALANDLAGSQYTLREVFGTFHSTGQIEGSKALEAIAKAQPTVKTGGAK